MILQHLIAESALRRKNKSQASGKFLRRDLFDRTTCVGICLFRVPFSLRLVVFVQRGPLNQNVGSVEINENTEGSEFHQVDE
jgi:hypothetical protein